MNEQPTTEPGPDTEPTTLLRSLFSGFGQELEYMHIDPDAAIVFGYLWRGESVSAQDVLDALDAALDARDGDGDLLDGQSLKALVGCEAWLPYGNSWRGMLRDVRALVADVAAQGPDYPLDESLPRPVRSSRWRDQPTAERATRTVLRRHEQRLLRWVGDPGRDWQRLTLYADLGRRLRGEQRLGPLGEVALPGTKTLHEAAGCTVVLSRTSKPGLPYVVATTFPEIAWRAEAVALRERWPALAQLLGGWFGPDFPDLDGGPVDCERRVHEQNPAERVARAVAELREALELPDDPAYQMSVVPVTGPVTLPEALHALGLGLQMVDHRRWARGFVRRASEVDWSGEHEDAEPMRRWNQWWQDNPGALEAIRNGEWTEGEYQPRG